MSRKDGDRALSKRLSYLLRHRPDVAGLALDARGWVSIDALLAGLARGGKATTRQAVARVVARNDKQRFAISDDGLRIRANQGHSVTVDLGLEPVAPPDVLFHGTVSKHLDGIWAEGLRPQGRHHVHLSADRVTAMKVGARRGRPVLLVVDAAAMAGQGHLFYRSANRVWLTDAVAPEYLGFDPGREPRG